MWYVRKYVRLKSDVLNCVKQFMLDNTKQGTTRIVDLTLLVHVTKLLLFCIVQKHLKALLVSSLAHGSESVCGVR